MTAQKPTYEELEQRIKYLENPELDRKKALDVVALNLAEVVDTVAIQSLMDDFFSLTNIGVAILDLNGKVLVATGWQDICTKFHRVHPESSKNCLKSDLELSNGVEPGTFRLYRCENNMWDIATPITVGDKHIGNLYLGQFLFEDETPDLEVFRSQAQKFGFNEEEYLAALERVPCWSKETVNTVMAFYAKLAHMISELSYSNIRIAQTLEALRKSEKKFSTLFHSSPVYIAFTALDDGCFLDVNDAFTKITGYQREEVLGRTPVGIGLWFNPEERTKFIKLAQQHGGFHEEEVKFRKKNGDALFGVWSAEKIELGGKTCLISVLVDVTERRRAEEALRVSDVKYKTLFDVLPVGVTVSDQAGNVVESNRVAEKILGLSKEEQVQRKIDGEEWHIVKHDGSPMSTGEYASTRALKENRLVENVEMGIVKGTDETSWINVTATPIPMENYGVAIAYMDITHRKQSEEALRESEERYRSLFTSTNDGVCLHEVIYENNKPIDYRILDFNPKYESITGVSRDDAIGVLASKLYGSGEAPYMEIYANVSETGKTASFETYFEPMDKHFHISVFSPDIHKFATVFQDITERKRAEAERERLLNQLAQAQKMNAIGTLAGGIAHDFNNILGIILGNTELAMDDVPEWNPARNNLDEVRKACLRAKDVVRQILTFSRKSEMEQKPINIAPVVTETLKLLRASIPTSVDIRQNIANDIHDILGDPTQIHQIMINLCTNAAHAMEDEGGILEVTLKNTEIDEDTASRYPELNPGPYVQLRVSDTGEGISHEVIERIFDPYFTTKDVGKGTGLGLSVVHGIVNSHQGRISVESKAGKGTTFSILFPAVKGKTREEPKEFQELPTGMERILFVDDEDAMVNLNQQRLEKLGYTVIPKTDPSEALEFFRANPDQIDLVITDMTMPRMTGDRLTEEILKIRPDMPIILCTGYSQRMSDDRAKELGIRKYIEKPIEMENLARSVREVLDGH